MKHIILNILVFFVFVLGIFYLVDYSSLKYYWHDETLVLLNLSGHSQKELVEQLYDGQIKTQNELHQFQQINSQKSLDDTIKSSHQTTPHWPPLYITLLWIWAKVFGSSDLALRSLSVVIWLGCIFCFYHLTFMLFAKQNVALIATTFFFLSSRFINYALDVWQYGLFALMTVLSSLLFLKALKSQKSMMRWIVYGIALIAGLYTHIFFLFVAIAHLIYIRFNQDSIHKSNKTYYPFIFVFSFLIYLPWFKTLIDHDIKIYNWARVNWPLSDLLNRWINTVVLLFYNWNLPLFIAEASKYIILVIFCFSVVHLVMYSNKEIWFFVILLMTVPFLPLVFYDLLSGTRYSSVGRFYLPSLIGVFLSVSFLINQGFEARNKVWRSGSYLVFSALISLSLITKFPYPQGDQRYQGYGSVVPNAALLINQTEKPLVIGETWLNMLPLSHKTKETTHYLFIKHLNELNIDIKRDYSNIYILKPSSSLRQKFNQADITLERTANKALWQITDMDFRSDSKTESLPQSSNH